jgi:hypothetical protein
MKVTNVIIMHRTLFFIKLHSGAEGEAEVVERLLSKLETMSSNPSTTKKKKKSKVQSYIVT